MPALPTHRFRRSRLTQTAAALAALLTGFPGPAFGQSNSPVSPVTQVAGAIVEAFDRLFGGPYEGSRPVHTKGVLLEGTFTPTAEAAGLSGAEHFTAKNTPILVRFSNFAGIPTSPDASDAASPRGMAIKFVLPDDASTDIVAHSYNGFPASTPEAFLAFLGALHSKDPAVLPKLLASSEAARVFVATPKPTPESYATEAFFGVNAFVFTNSEGVSRHGKYILTPVDGRHYLGAADAAAMGRDFLAKELATRTARGPVRFKLGVQLAGENDSFVDAALPWPAERPVVEMGTLSLSSIPERQDEKNRSSFFTPLNLVAGISPSADPMLTSRSRAYRLSFNRRNSDHGMAPNTQ